MDKYKTGYVQMARENIDLYICISYHFNSLADLFNQTPSQLLWEASSHVLHLMPEDCSYTYPILSIARYSFIQLGDLEPYRVKKRAQGFNSNTGSLSRESKAPPSEPPSCIRLVPLSIFSQRHNLIQCHVK